MNDPSQTAACCAHRAPQAAGIRLADGFCRRDAGYLVTALPTTVAQTCSLQYRRFITCGASAKSKALGVGGTLPIRNRRYGRLKICATVNTSDAGSTLHRAFLAPRLIYA